MRQSSILPFGLLAVCCTIGFVSPGQAASVPPVIRANGFTKQVPSCYIETTSSGFQNLDAACLMGKVPDSGTIDMVTDRDKDGVPDELQLYFKEMDAMGSVSADKNPAAQLAKAERAAKMLQRFAQRAPVAPNLKAGLNEAAGLFSEMARISVPMRGNAPSPDTLQKMQQLSARMDRMNKTMSDLNKDPFMQKVTEYANIYGQNQAKQRNSLRK
jgi:hypothetical protein